MPRIKLKTAKEFNVHHKGPHLRPQGDSLKGTCPAKCSKFDIEKFENSIIALKDACTPMQGIRVFINGNHKIFKPASCLNFHV